MRKALNSVAKQSYSPIEIIVVDDASKDLSQNVIREFVAENPSFIPLLLDRNIGNCAAFNKGYRISNGKYIIDFATDDVMAPDRVERQVAYFESLSENYGVIYSNARYIDGNNRFLFNHFGTKASLKSLKCRYSGDVYKKIFEEFFIPPPTMMIKREVLDKLGGYDETLAYEDFDFWVRSSRDYEYGYQDEFLTDIRKTSTSYSTKWYKPGDKQLLSTYRVCIKALKFNNSVSEKVALLKRVKFEIRQAVFSNNFIEADCFFMLLKSESKMSKSYKFLYWLNSKRLNLSFLRTVFHKIRYYRLFLL